MQMQDPFMPEEVHQESRMQEKVFSSREELVQEVTRIAHENGIEEVFQNTPHVHMMVCQGDGKGCCARVVGMYDQKHGVFKIMREELSHACKEDQTGAIISEIKKRHTLRTGRLLEELVVKGLVVGYEEVWMIQKWLLQTEGTLDIKEWWNSESKGGDENYGNTKKEEMAEGTALAVYCRELLELNSRCYAKSTSNSFFLRQHSFSKALRFPVELKVYARNGGYLVFALQYDPSNEPLVQSFIITSLPKGDSIKLFIEFHRAGIEDAREKGELSAVEDHYKNFFVIDTDMEIIELMTQNGVDVFLKTRNLCSYLEEGKDYDPLSFQYFHECNYGSKEFLKLDKKYYLRRFSPYPLFGINNMPLSDLDFITPSLLKLTFFESLTAILNAVSESILVRKKKMGAIAGQLPDAISEMIESFPSEKSSETDLSTAHCWCGKFQEFLLPCSHAVTLLKECGVEPFYYVSSVFLLDNLTKIQTLVPPVSLSIDSLLPISQRLLKTGKLYQAKSGEILS